MTLPSRMYRNPQDYLECAQNFEASLVCKSCIHHAYVGSDRVRFCNKHDLAGNALALCGDYREKKCSRLEKIQSLFGEQ